MRNRALLLVTWTVFGAAACDALGGKRPLVGVDAPPDAGGAAPPDAGGVAPPDAGRAEVLPPSNLACWSGQLPAQAQPLLPHSSVPEICGAEAEATSWTYPTDANPNADGRANVVGRWATCSTSGLFTVAHDGVEFGANGRWRLLAADATGALVPMSGGGSGVTGYYYLLGTGQIDIADDATTRTRIAFLTFAAEMDAARFSDATGSATELYARTVPSPVNGNDNLPSVSDGRCSMVGDWDLPANPNPPGAPAATFSFDAAGNFVGGPQGSDLCASHTMYGTYQLTPGWFQLTTNIGLGACQWWFAAAYPASFSADCSSVTLTQMYDNCTGGRGYFNQVTTMTRRQ